MITFLAKIFIKDHGNTGDPDVRRKYGMLCSVAGIILNVMLFAGKYFAGVLSGSVAITADAFNNLSDAGSSFITLFGFKFAGMKPDTDHPFGHGRIEYVAGLAVSALIMLMGFELAKTSVGKILEPAPIEFSVVSLCILAASIAVKLYMSFYNKRIGKKLNSAAMQATAVDSLSDAVSTTVVFAAMVFYKITNINIDGWCGALVSLLILYASFGAAKDTIDPLLGQAPDPEFVKEIESTVMAYDEIVGIHDLVVHNYGPGRVMISLHAEVPADGDIFRLHDSVDSAEKDLRDILGCEAVIHMDPISTNDEEVCVMREKIAEAVKVIDPRLTIHDLRIVRGPTHTNVIFDALIPHRFYLSNAETKERISELVSLMWDNTYAVIEIEHSYVE